MTKYENGRKIEYTITHILRDAGYTVIRSAGSKGAFDVVAFNGKTIRLIQSKLSGTEHYSYSAEVNKMLGIVVPQNATIELWIYVKNKGFCEIKTTNCDLEYPKGARIESIKQQGDR